MWPKIYKKLINIKNILEKHYAFGSTLKTEINDPPSLLFRGPPGQLQDLQQHLQDIQEHLQDQLRPSSTTVGAKTSEKMKSIKSKTLSFGPLWGSYV